MPLMIAPVERDGADWVRAVGVDEPPPPLVLSRTQMKILVFILQQQRIRGVSPTYREIAAAVQLHRSSVAYQIVRLAALGAIERVSGSARAITVRVVPGDEP